MPQTIKVYNMNYRQSPQPDCLWLAATRIVFQRLCLPFTQTWQTSKSLSNTARSAQ